VPTVDWWACPYSLHAIRYTAPGIEDIWVPNSPSSTRTAEGETTTELAPNLLGCRLCSLAPRSMLVTVKSSAVEPAGIRGGHDAPIAARDEFERLVDARWNVCGR